MRKMRLIIFFTTLISITSFAADSMDVEYDPPQRLDARFRLFKTKNTWNFLELDSQTGKVWQVQFVIKENEARKKLVVNPDILAKDGRPGRFTLHPTRNMFNFILLDQENGNTWQVQFSTENDQGIWAIEQKKEKTNSEWKQ
jgi:hypothetical protein